MLLFADSRQGQGYCGVSDELTPPVYGLRVLIKERFYHVGCSIYSESCKQ
jgi:hypothetical protein